MNYFFNIHQYILINLLHRHHINYLSDIHLRIIVSTLIDCRQYFLINVSAMKRIFSLPFFLIVFTHAQAALEPLLLKTEYLINPLAINTTKPRLSWQLKSDQRNQYQSAFEIIVSEHHGDVESGKGTTWTSGKQISGENINISYAGKQ